ALRLGPGCRVAVGLGNGRGDHGVRAPLTLRLGPPRRGLLHLGAADDGRLRTRDDQARIRPRVARRRGERGLGRRRGQSGGGGAGGAGGGPVGSTTVIGIESEPVFPQTSAAVTISRYVPRSRPGSRAV